MTCFPATIVGALRLPVGPSMLSRTSLDTFLPPSNDKIFLPLATVIFCAADARATASSRPNLRDAGITSFAVIFCASINLEALSQLVQPFLK